MIAVIRETPEMLSKRLGRIVPNSTGGIGLPNRGIPTRLRALFSRPIHADDDTERAGPFKGARQ
jgi:hypothetical protein